MVAIELELTYLCVMMKVLKSKYKAIKVNGKKIDLHRHIMQSHLGRQLGFNECVHHIDGNKLNNNLENLVVIDRGSHMKHHIENGDIPMSKITTNGRIVLCESLSSVTVEQAIRIKYMGEPPKTLINELGVSKYCINRIRTGKSWKHI